MLLPIIATLTLVEIIMAITIAVCAGVCALYHIGRR